MAAVGLAVASLVLGTAGTASANSFEKPVYQGRARYNDGEDRFCVKADETGIRDRALIQATLTPYNSARGPVVRLADLDTPGRDCGSLATAYEDTKYRAKIQSATGFDRITGTTTWKTYYVDFWS